MCHGWDQVDPAVKELDGLKQVKKRYLSQDEWEIVDELKDQYGSGWTDHPSRNSN